MRGPLATSPWTCALLGRIQPRRPPTALLLPSLSLLLELAASRGIPKVPWNDLLSPDGGAHVNVAKLPDQSDAETLPNGRAPQQLLERLITWRIRRSGYEGYWSASYTYCARS